MASDEHGGGGIGAGRGEVDAAAPLDAIKIRGRIVSHCRLSAVYPANMLFSQHHHLRTCSAAVKKARAFEVQKTVKKLKGATDEERGGLESLLQALKGSNHAQIAAIAIKSKFVKARLLPRATMTDGEDVHQQYPLMAHIDELEAYLKSGEGSSSVNVDAEKARAKLLSNKVVSEEVSKMVKVTSALLRGEEPTKQDKAGDKTERRDRRETVSVNEKTTRAKRQRETDLSSDQEGASASTSEAETVLDAVSDNDDEGSILRTTGGQEAKPVSVGKLSLSADFSKRKSDTDERDGQRPSKQLRKDTQSHDGDESDGEEESAEGLLPALSTGFVGGRGFNLGRNSEDEWSDGDADLESIDEDVEGDANRKEARKNRMGQRARRA